MTQAAVKEVREFSRLVEIPGISRWFADDPDDDMVVESAVVGNATHIVTGDKHLLSLTSHQSIAIVKAAEFVAIVGIILANHYHLSIINFLT